MIPTWAMALAKANNLAIWRRGGATHTQSTYGNTSGDGEGDGITRDLERGAIFPIALMMELSSNIAKSRASELRGAGGAREMAESRAAQADGEVDETSSPR